MKLRHKNNLLKLADFLENELEDDQFNIHLYKRDQDGNYIATRNSHNCGSIGCAIGWSTRVFGPTQHTHYDVLSKELYGCHANDNNIGSYMFSADMPFKEGGRLATIKRIRDIANDLVSTKQREKLLEEIEENKHSFCE